MIDLLLRGGRVVDGSGAPAFGADVAVAADRIAEIGRLGRISARRTIDLDGLVLAPGFIDLHTHADFTLPVYPRGDAFVRQGVTTIMTGNCGFSPFPVAPGRLRELRTFTAFVDGGLSWEWRTAGEYLDHLERLPLAVNVAVGVGHGALRVAAMGFEARAPREAELARMRELASQALHAGGAGLTFGLTYAPGSFATTDELVALAATAARFGRSCAFHVRDEGDGLCEAVGEALTVGRRAGAGVQLSHHKALGHRNRGRVSDSLALIDAARIAGEDVTADAYPYAASSTTLASILPRWTLDGGIEGLRSRLRDGALRARIRAEIEDPTGREFDPEAVVLSTLPEGPWRRFEGSSVAALARHRREPPVETALALLADAGGGAQIVNRSMDADDVRTVLRHPAVAVASDGWTLHPAAGGKPHPRNYGTFARVLGRYVREEGLLSLEEAIRKMTSLPAARLWLNDRGRIAPGLVADLVAFDQDTIVDRATYEDPHRFADGIQLVLVGGRIVLDRGQDSGAEAGKVLRTWPASVR